jgi:hypothetical protein
MNKYSFSFLYLHQSFRSYDIHEINAQTASGKSKLKKESFDVFELRYIKRQKATTNQLSKSQLSILRKLVFRERKKNQDVFLIVYHSLYTNIFRNILCG